MRRSSSCSRCVVSLPGVASNVNQLARAANVDGRLAVGSTAALAEVRVVVAKIAVLEGLAA